jgi:hypothetical protein
MVEDVVRWETIRATDRSDLAAGEGGQWAGDVYEEWLAATKIAYTQGG